MFCRAACVPTCQGVTNEHFIVWMRTAALPQFRKLYGKINSDIPAGTTLTFDVDAYFEVTSFGGKKSLGKSPLLVPTLSSMYRKASMVSRSQHGTMVHPGIGPHASLGVCPNAVLSTVSWFGGKNDFLGISYIVVGTICLALALAFAAKQAICPRKLGDTRYLGWKEQ